VPSPTTCTYERWPGAARAPLRRPYARHAPETTLLSQVVATHLETFLARRADDGAFLPRFVERELRAYLACGILAHGFARVRCGACGDEKLVAFSCKGRGVCPSCTGRRMTDTAAHLVDRVLPRTPVRQWVLSFPHRVRFALARDARLLGEALRIFTRAIFAWQRRAARAAGVARACPGAVTFVQRFGSALQLTPHFHTLVPDGVFLAPARDGQRAVFVPLAPPHDADVEWVAARVADRVDALLRRRGGLASDADPPTDPLALALAAAARPPPSAARAVPPLALPAPPRTARVRGFSLHADRAVHENDRDGLERLCRYGLRPPLALDRLHPEPDGRLRYVMKRTFSDGTRALVLTPDDLLARLSALVPPPRVHTVRYHGVFASAAALRPAVTGQPRRPRRGRAHAGAAPMPPAPAPPASLPAHVTDVTEAVAPTDAANASVTPPAPGRARRLPWAELLRRVYAVDVLACPCGARAEVIAFVTAPDACVQILRHLGLPSRPPPLAPARAPPHDTGLVDDRAHAPAYADAVDPIPADD